MSEFILDDKDKSILELLSRDCSKTKEQMAKKLGLPLTTLHNRIGRMEREAIILGYRASLNPRKLGLDVSAHVLVSAAYGSWDFSQEEMARKIRSLEGVESVSIVTGACDLVAKVRKKNTAELNDFVINRLRKIPGVEKTETMVVLSEFD